MESRDNFRERFEALEQQTEQLKHQTHAFEAHTCAVERRRRWWRGIACGLVVLGLLSWAPPLGTAQDLLQQPSQSPRVLEPSPPMIRTGPYGHLPLSFEANQGQTDDQVQFLAHGQGYTLFLTAREAVFTFRPPAAHTQHPTRLVPRPGAGPDTPGTARAVVHMQLLRANPAPKVVGLEELPGKANYFIGNDPQQWRANVPTYAKVKYAAVYPGVDLVYYGQSRQLEYDFVVAPGADPTTITLGFAGVDHVDVDAQGDLWLATAGGSLRFQKPVVYQEEGGRRQAIAGDYVRKGLHQVGFQLAAYDVARPLVIDPVLSYSTYLGGSGDNEAGQGIAVDTAGAAYVTGFTNSSDFPTVHPLQPTLRGGVNAFVAKLTADGSALVYATYLGGSGSDDEARGIAVDTAGNAYVTGYTTSPDFPTIHPLQPVYGGNGDAFVAKLNATGSALVYSTYLGGSDYEDSFGIAVDAVGAAYVIGSTGSPDFPTRHPLQPTLGGGGQNAFIAKLAPSGTALVYSTYLGGSGYDYGVGIAIDAIGAAYITGLANSPDFPTVHPLQPTLLNGSSNAFIAKLAPSGTALVYSTYLGGSGYGDAGIGIAVDAAGAAYVTGYTASTDFPTVHPLQSTPSGAFVAKIAAPAFAGTPGTANCHGESVSALTQQFGGLDAAASALGFPSVQALQDAIQEFCEA